MKEQILKLKLELKNLVKTIRIQKNKRSAKNNGYVEGLDQLRSYARHKHVLYCLARGRTLEQVDSGKGLDMDYINFQLEAMKEDKKLYVVVDKSLPISVQAVQAAHAVAEFMKQHPTTAWKNGTLVMLKADLRYGMYYKYRWRPYEFAAFNEPDMKGNPVTAFAVFGPKTEEHFKDLPLV